jgi:hypothetical protein
LYGKGQKEQAKTKEPPQPKPIHQQTHSPLTTKNEFFMSLKPEKGKGKVRKIVDDKCSKNKHKLTLLPHKIMRKTTRIHMTAIACHRINNINENRTKIDKKLTKNS